MNGRVDQLWAEVVYIAYHLHWSFDSILDLDHFSRARVIGEINSLQIGGTDDALVASATP